MKLFKRKNTKPQEIDLDVECRVLIDSGDFQKNILDYVTSEEFDKMFFPKGVYPHKFGVVLESLFSCNDLVVVF